MTLTEVLAGSTVALAAVLASLQLWGAALHWSQGEELRLQQLEAMEEALLRQRSRLRQQARDVVAPIDCAAAAEWLENQLLATPVPPQLQRQVIRDADGLVRLALSAQGGALERQRRWSPVSFGLCSGGGS